jgi:hypothetical protein
MVWDIFTILCLIGAVCYHRFVENSVLPIFLGKTNKKKKIKRKKTKQNKRTKPSNGSFYDTIFGSE